MDIGWEKQVGSNSLFSMHKKTMGTDGHMQTQTHAHMHKGHIYCNHSTLLLAQQSAQTAHEGIGMAVLQ